MASGDNRAAADAHVTGKGLRVGTIRARWNSDIVERLAHGVDRGLDRLEVSERSTLSVPGCFEIPMAAKLLAESGTVDAIICIGVVIRGETTHYEIVAEGAAVGIQQVQLATGIPIAFGLLTVENQDQALARSQAPVDGVSGHNVGEEAALVAVEMATLANQLRTTDLTS